MTDERIEAAAENIAAAEEQQAEAAMVAASGVVTEKVSEAAVTAVAAAEAGAALANANAAKVIVENEGDMVWLKTNVEQVVGSLKGLADSQETLKQQVNQSQENQAQILTALQSLTPKPSEAAAQNQETEIVNPKEKDHAEDPPAIPPVKPKAKRRFI